METRCGDCAKEGRPVTAHTACAQCAERGVDVVRLALLHQVSTHGLPEAVLDAKPVVFWPWKIPRGAERERVFSASGPLVAA